MNIERGGYRRINPARYSDNNFIHADLLKEIFNAVIKRTINLRGLGNFRQFKRGHFVNLVKLDKIQTLLEQLGTLNNLAA